MGEPEKQDKCPLCSCDVPLVLLDLHVNSHLDEEDAARDMALAQRIAAISDPLGCSSEVDEEHGVFLDFVSCDRGCNQDVPIHEWDSHCLQHRLALEEAASNLAQSCDRGLSKRARHSEGQPSEWQLNKCLRGKPLEENVKSLVGCQIRETVFPVKEGVIRLLQKCLEADLNGGFSAVALSGYVEHFESRHREDLGWGCGWRNIQMLSSHLLMQNPEAKDALFGGCGFVPDILALQRWLEIAWARGFDKPGAEYFDWEITGTHKWIGTTECAALLRSFGMRARIVDFQAFGKSGKETPVAQKIGSGSSTACCALQVPESGSSAPSRQPSPVESEEGECTVCGEFPIRGTRYCHGNTRNNDVCVSCMIGLRNSANKQERAMAEGYSAVPDLKRVANGKGDDTEAMNKHRQMVDWVWNYFMGKTTSLSSSTSAFDRLRQPITLSRRSPLYFQHEGHSRTIVGVERRRRLGLSEEVFLLVLDPSQRTEDLVTALRERRGWQKLLKRGLHTLKKAEYQLCYVDEGVAKGDELESLKVLSSGHYSC